MGKRFKSNYGLKRMSRQINVITNLGRPLCARSILPRFRFCDKGTLPFCGVPDTASTLRVGRNVGFWTCIHCDLDGRSSKSMTIAQAAEDDTRKLWSSVLKDGDQESQTWNSMKRSECKTYRWGTSIVSIGRKRPTWRQRRRGLPQRYIHTVFSTFGEE